MASRWFKLALLAYVAVWFSVVVPGHQRGQVALPGARVASAGCCADLPVARHGAAPVAPHRLPASRGCAICFFAAHLSVPPAIDIAQTPLGFLCLLTPPAPGSVAGRAVHLPFDGRAPPATA